METLKKVDGIAGKWSNVKPVSSYGKNYELIWDKIKHLDTQSEQNSEYIDHIDDDRANYLLSSPLRLWKRWITLFSIPFIKHKNLNRCELSSGEVSLKRVVIDNLELDDPSLVATAKKLKIMILDKDSHSTDVFYHQRCSDKFTRDYKPVESNREDKNSVEKATAEKMFLALLKTQVLNQKSCFFLRDSMAVK